MIKLPKEVRSYKNFHYVTDKLKESNKYVTDVQQKYYLIDICLDRLTPKQQEYIKPIRHLLSKSNFVFNKIPPTYINDKPKIGGYSLCIHFDKDGLFVTDNCDEFLGNFEFNGTRFLTSIYQNRDTLNTILKFEPYLKWYNYDRPIIISMNVQEDAIDCDFSEAYNPFAPTQEEIVMFELQTGQKFSLVSKDMQELDNNLDCLYNMKLKYTPSSDYLRTGLQGTSIK